MLAFHEEGGYDLTIAAFPVPLAEASRYGVLEVDAEGGSSASRRSRRSRGRCRGSPDLALASMGNYVFRANVLIEALEHDALQDTSHDFGKNLIPSLLKGGRAALRLRLLLEPRPGNEDLAPYWRDVGTVDSYWDASMDLISVTPPLNLYNQKWPIKSHSPSCRRRSSSSRTRSRSAIGLATDSMVAAGCIISGGTIHRSILFPRVRINSFSHVEECVLMDGVEVGRYARLRRVIADKGVKIPARIEIGFDEEEDRKRFHVSDGGVVVLPKGVEIPSVSSRVARSRLNWPGFSV